MIDTDDGKSYSIVYGCSYILGISRVESIYILTRSALEKGTTQWQQMQAKVLGSIQSKFAYEGGASKYWDPEWFNWTPQGDKVCDYSLTYENQKGKDL